LSFRVSGGFSTSQRDGATAGATGGGRGPIWGSPHATHQPRLTPATIDNAKPKDRRYDLTDGGGLVLEVMPSDPKTWRFKYHLNGRREKVTIGAQTTTIAATRLL